MLTIRQATVDDCYLINQLAKEVFPATYRDLLSPEQLNYMMEWMYAPTVSESRCKMRDMSTSLLIKMNHLVAICLYKRKRKEYIIYRRYMYSPLFREYIVVVSYLEKLSNTLKVFTLNLA